VTTTAPRTYLVTGSASGIGAATTELLRSRGHAVLTLDLHRADVCVDLGTADGRAEAVRQVSAHDGGLDAVIACAAIFDARPETVSINYFGVVELLEGLRPILERSPAPRVAVMASWAAMLAFDQLIVDACLVGDEVRARQAVEDVPDANRRAVVYSSTKRALVHWLRRTAVREEWGGRRIMLNALVPSTVETPMIAAQLASPAAREQWHRDLPTLQHRLAAPEEVAQFLGWLTSAENSRMVGQVVFADLGRELITRGESIYSS
jgi:NAD(P)-dependent dehydrogenase (short-subunit alcohol dehydrogenase family)